MKISSLLLALALLFPLAQAASITTIQLQNRPAEEVIPVIEPMLSSGDVISGRGFKLFLRASPETLSQVRQMLEVLDRPAKVLQISVFQGSTRGLGELGLSGSVQIEGSDGSANIGSSGNGSNGGGITFSTDGGSASIAGTSTRQRLSGSPIHQVRVTEGSEAYIETGQQIPYFSGAGRALPRHSAGGVEFKKAVTGFYVLPRINGDRVTLLVSPFKNTPGNTPGGNIQTQSAHTTLTGRLGDWLLIGGVSEELRQSQKGTGSTTSTRSRRNDSIWIKADLVR